MQRGRLIVVEGLDKAGKSTQCAAVAEHINLRQRQQLDQQQLDQHHHQASVVGPGPGPGPGLARIQRFPERSPAAAPATGALLDAYLRGEREIASWQASHLLFAANRWERAGALERELVERGATLVLDRYCYSGWAYSVAGSGGGVDLAWARACDAGLPRPDLVVFLDLDAGGASARGDGSGATAPATGTAPATETTSPSTSPSPSPYGHERYEHIPMQRRVQAAFDDILARAAAAGGDGDGVGACIFARVDADQPVAAVRQAVLAAVDGLLAQACPPLRRIGPAPAP